MGMNTDTLHLAPKALRLALARHVVAAAMAKHESDHSAHAEVEGGDEQADHDRAARVLRMKDAATNHADPVQYPEVNDAVSKRAAAEAAKPEPATSARTRSGRIYAATCSAWVGVLPARAGVVRINQSAVTVAPLTFANAITPSQCSAGIRFRAAHARTFTGSVSTVGAAATLAAPPSEEISEA